MTGLNKLCPDCLRKDINSDGTGVCCVNYWKGYKAGYDAGFEDGGVNTPINIDPNQKDGLTDAVDLTKCPNGCGNDADRGFSRDHPPVPYVCSSCSNKELTNTWKGKKVRPLSGVEWLVIDSAYLDDKNNLVFRFEGGFELGIDEIEFEEME